MRFLRRRRARDLRTLAHAASLRAVGGTHTPLDVEVLVWAGGDLALAHAPLLRTLDRVREELPDALLTVLIDGPEWEDSLRPWLSACPQRREIALPRPTDLPQVLYLLGLATGTHPWTAWLWAGCEVDGPGLRRLRAAAGSSPLVHGEAATLPPAGYAPPAQHAWLQMADLVPMHNALVGREAAGAAAGEPTPLLQRAFWWDLTLRLSARAALAHAPVTATAPRWDWSSYPLRPPEAAAPDVAARFVARRSGEVATFAGDLPQADAEGLASSLARWSHRHGLAAAVPAPAARSAPLPGRWPLKVTVLSGLLDGHQNQLYFLGYFERMAGRGLVAWRTVLYDRCRPEDLAGSDLAVFSRPRFPEVPALLDAAEAAGVPVLVMIDDNWPAAGREYARFEPLFTPGRPALESFLEALRRADAALVFNPVLEDELRPLARRVLRLPFAVDLSLFQAPALPRAPGFLAGFAGSARWEPSGFQGLAGFLRRHQDARLLVMGHDVPDELREVDPGRVVFVPWQHHYAAYARTLAGMRPDVLIAPLDASRFTASKVPTKFVEAAAAGAAGIYSRLPPYTEHVRDGLTGLLVDNDAAAWLDALERLHADPALRARLAEEAAREAAQHFSLDAVLPRFASVLQATARPGRT
jgi:glycosyltransferase involved in cell wall biosynthesis